jgi:hypothetical protein
MKHRLLCAAVVLLAGCTSSGEPSAPTSGSAAGAAATAARALSGPPPATVSSLVGVWTVAGPGVPVHTELWVKPTSLQVRRACGDLEAGWVGSTDGQFAAAPNGPGGCPDDVAGGQKAPAWLVSAVRFRSRLPGWALLGRAGAVLATLTPGTTPRSATRGSPTIRPDQAARLDRVLPPLPTGMSPVTAAELVGAWAPDEQSPSALVFRADGRVGNGRDRWLLDAGGAVLITSDVGLTFGNTCWRGSTPSWKTTPSPQPYGCRDILKIASWFGGTRVVRQQNALVLYDGSGAAVHRLVRANPSKY